jgi:hypothetical protein
MNKYEMRRRATAMIEVLVKQGLSSYMDIADQTGISYGAVRSIGGGATKAIREDNYLAVKQLHDRLTSQRELSAQGETPIANDSRNADIHPLSSAHDVFVRTVQKTMSFQEFKQMIGPATVSVPDATLRIIYDQMVADMEQVQKEAITKLDGIKNDWQRRVTELALEESDNE